MRPLAMAYPGKQLSPTEKPSIALRLNWRFLAKMSANPVGCLSRRLYGLQKRCLICNELVQEGFGGRSS